ncbi:hypothetical protein [Pedobacter hiemivivus]|uniref:Uncharacterized protein n=1 Tax=Pedobacter hiemivivus TaxID=2530454 RepID=A0A4R0NEC2_9SPHI|nr:hypothetical protein [Pedobacter hiemivivus]TCC98478.1 hypothetical protein EZ444_04130 [Pedobacter hiemivivus]
MKNFKFQFLLVLLVVLFIAGCSAGLEQNIPGTYVNKASSEFSIAYDTLVVEHDKDLNYLIHRKTGFQLIDEKGRVGDLQIEREAWKAVYDEGSQSMTENRKGRVISFEFKQGLLILENSRYQRIN